MSISTMLEGDENSQQARANGISFAWMNGASVINNSWFAAIDFPIFAEPIGNALTYGRNGLGTVVVFAAGNTYDSVSYPANSNPDILVVGAIDMEGERAPYSGYDN